MKIVHTKESPMNTKRIIGAALAIAVFAALIGCASPAPKAGTPPQARQGAKAAGGASAQGAGPRYALVIGNADYRNIEKLDNTVNDAQDIAAALQGLGFNVDLKLNLTRLQFGAALDGYVEKLAADSTSEGFFWYAGHGVQIEDRNYLLPVDAGIESERALRRDAYSLDELLADFENASNKVNVVVLDACRNNPLPSSSRGAGGTRGLAAVQDVPGDLFVMFSTAAGDVAADGKGSRNSPFAEAFLKYIDSPEPLVLMASDVINETMASTNNAQRPFSRGSIISDKRYSLNPAATYTSVDLALTFFEEGQSRMSGQDWDAAIESFTVAIRLDPQFSRAYSNRGSAYDEKGEYDKAIADYTQAIRIDPNDASVHYNQGNAYRAKGEYDKAIADYTQAIRINPNYAYAYNNRGNAYKAKGEYDKAIADYTQAIRINPNDAAAYNNRGSAYNDKGEPDKPIADYTEAIRINPNYADAYNNRGIAYGDKGEPGKAIADFTQAIRIDPNNADAYYNRGFAQANRGNFDRAIADSTESIRLAPNDADAYFVRGCAYFMKEDYARTRADFEKTLQIDPYHAGARTGLELLREEGH
jgi:tetratricopeptide (TPR) repeat protein